MAAEFKIGQYEFVFGSGRTLTLRRLPLWAISEHNSRTKSCSLAWEIMGDTVVREYENSSWLLVAEVASDETRPVKPVYYRLEDGKFVLGTCKFDISFEDKITLAEAEALVTAQGLELCSRYLVGNTFDCKGPSPEEAIQAAVRLAELRCVESVEPHLYQRISHR